MSGSVNVLPTEDLIRDASAPFDARSARVIIISSDRMRFRVHENIVTLASPILTTLIDRGRLSFERNLEKGVDSVIHLSDDGKSSYSGAARKYGMDMNNGVAECALRAAFGSDPLGAYCVAFTFGLQDCAAAAAKNLLQTPFSDLDSPHIDLLSGSQYRDVMRYHDECGVAAHREAVQWYHEVPCLVAFQEWIPCEGPPQPPSEWGHAGKCLVVDPANRPSWTDGNVDDYFVAPNDIIHGTTYGLGASGPFYRLSFSWSDSFSASGIGWLKACQKSA
ncbi:hypothetical protein FA95DRAFT_1612109 [Auriscalpium vulgare]|uniref:Uncharacterized protein n=1 Tax=Auriscalpium vulgare TaxID=40419 RepID=A0ACB8R790_9AGAM|nr:hypothetical protein FA95DRAFT_1612109 [Auriscalpium vulgare]